MGNHYTQKQNGKHERLKTVLGFLICPAVFLLCSLLTCAIRFAGKDPTAHIGMFSMLDLLLSAAFCSYLSARKNRGEEGAFRRTVMPGVAFALTVLLVALILTKGKLPLPVPLNLICYLLVFMLVALLAGKKPKKKHRFM